MVEKKVRCWISILFVILFLIVPFTFAQNTQQPKKSAGKTILDYSNKLKLTAKQKEAVKAYLFDLEEKNKQLTEKINSLVLELRILLERNSDMEKIAVKLRKLFSFKAEAAIADIKTGRKIDNLLTPQQVKNWRKMRLKEVQRIRKMN